MNLLSQEVDPFTGDFTYTIPLLQVPSPDGRTVPISIIYRSGIKVEQFASEVGLGWELDAGGGINRYVNGIPDDWNKINTVNREFQDKREHTGPLNFYKSPSIYVSTFNNPIFVTGANIYDFYTSTYKMEGYKFHFPDYDNYNVMGPLINGVLEPKLFDYVNINLPNWENSNFYGDGVRGLDEFHSDEFTKKPQFYFKNNYSGDPISAAYPTPITPFTTAILPEDVSPDFDGVGYVNGQNRMVTPNYVEYFTNQEIQDHNDGITPINGGFIDFKAGYQRTAANSDMDGIGAFRITDAGGITYHYSLPLYRKNQIKGTYPLNNEYEFVNDEPFLLAGAENSDYIKTNETGQTVETRRIPKYAYSWYLAAITGPNYIDVNTNGIADEGDKGYWVNYDWQPWSLEFKRKFPFYGYDYSFAAEEDFGTDNLPVSEENKLSGKFGSTYEFETEVYFLNEIKTSSHTAVFVRDLRLDEHSGLSLHGKSFVRENMKDNTLINITGEKGFLYDNGGPSGKMVDNGWKVGGDTALLNAYYGNANIVCTATIKPSNANVDYIELTIDQFNFNPQRGDYLEIYDGDNTNPGSLIGRFGTVKYQNDYPTQNLNCYDPYNNADDFTCQIITSPPTKINSTGDAITLKLFTSNYNNYSDLNCPCNPPPTLPWNQTYIQPFQGFAISWETFYTTTPAPEKTTPRLKLNKVILFRNDDLNQIPIPTTTFSSPDPAWDFSKTTLGSSGIYTIDWYNANQTAIHDIAIKTVEFNQDYSLAKKNHTNVNVSLSQQHLLTTTSPIDVLDNIVVNNYAQSGKLTLNEIIFYEQNHEQVIPSILFDYNTADPLDNPNFNPLKRDNWEFFKLNSYDKAVQQFTSIISKDYTDAWSLRKITSPVGGEIEIEYESNEYEKVHGEDVLFERVSEIYPIINATPVSGQLGTDWQITIEGAANEFWDFTQNLPPGTTYHVFIPFTSSLIACYHNQETFISSGVGSFQADQQSITGLDFYHVENGYSDPNVVNWCSPSDLLYTGNGYVYFEFPLETKLFGGGTRVKSLIVKNGIEGSYKTEFTYLDGVASSVPRMFKKPEQKEDMHGNLNYIKLRTYIDDRHRPSSEIGYSKTIIKNISQDGSDNGSTIYKYFTTDNQDVNFKPIISLNQIGPIFPYPMSCPSPGGLYIRGDSTYIVEFTDRTSSLWGNLREAEVKDVNDNTISLTKNQYSRLTQGSVVEHFNFTTFNVTYLCIGCEVPPPPICTLRKNTISIKRSIPPVLTKQTRFSNGLEYTTEYIDFDKISGSPIKVKTTDPATGESVAETTPAFRITEFDVMGPKALNINNYNFIAEIAETRITNDQPITGNDDFISHTVNQFSKKFKIRSFDIANNKYQNIIDNNHFWRSVSSYSWAGPLGEYGMYNAGDYVAFNLSPGEVISMVRFDAVHFQTDHSHGYAVGDNVLIKGIPGFNGVYTTSFAVGDRLGFGVSLPITISRVWGTVQKDFPSFKWRINSEITLIDKREHILESVGTGDRFFSRKYGYDNRYLLAEILNTNYVGFTCSGFEDKINEGTDVNPKYYFEGEINYDDNNPASRVESDPMVRTAHTGNNYLRVTNASSSLPTYVIYYTKNLGVQRGRTYRASIWVQEDSPPDAELMVTHHGLNLFDNSVRRDASMRRDDPNAVQVGNWLLLNADITLPENYIPLHDLDISPEFEVTLIPGTGTSYFDDFRVHPIDAPLTVNVYDEKTGRVIAVLDNNNFATHYKYDNAGRIVEIMQETEEFGLKNVKEYNYSYARD